MRITLTPSARRDLHQIKTYLRENFPEKETQTLTRLEHIFQKFAEFPSMGKEGRLKGTKEYTIPGLPYVAIYRILQDELQILRIYHGSRNPSLISKKPAGYPS